jgi:hypothetical protein
LLLGDFALSRGRLGLLGLHESFSPVLCSKPFDLCFCLLQLEGQLDSFRIGDIPLRIVRNTS